MLGRKIIQNEAERVGREAGFTALPIDPFKIAADAGIEVQSKSMDAEGVSGMLIKAGDQFGILYATHIKSEGFRRFSVAHELGHYFLEGHMDAVLKLGAHVSRAGFASPDKYEREADLFAASLLMPEGAFRKAMRHDHCGLAEINRLAGLAGTSLTATAFRFSELTRRPMAVVLSTQGRIDVCFYSEALKDLANSRGGRLPFFKSGTSLPHGTRTNTFHGDQSNIGGGLSVEDVTTMADWFGIPDRSKVREEVQGLGSYGKTVTVLTCTTVLADDYDAEDEADDDEYLRERWTPKFRK